MKYSINEAYGAVVFETKDWPVWGGPHRGQLLQFVHKVDCRLCKSEQTIKKSVAAATVECFLNEVFYTIALAFERATLYCLA